MSRSAQLNTLVVLIAIAAVIMTIAATPASMPGLRAAAITLFVGLALYPIVIRDFWQAFPDRTQKAERVAIVGKRLVLLALIAAACTASAYYFGEPEPTPEELQASQIAQFKVMVVDQVPRALEAYGNSEGCTPKRPIDSDLVKLGVPSKTPWGGNWGRSVEFIITGEKAKLAPDEQDVWVLYMLPEGLSEADIGKALGNPPNFLWGFFGKGSIFARYVCHSQIPKDQQ